MQKKDLLVLAADKRYVLAARQVVNAARGAGRWRGDVMLLCKDLDADDLVWFSENEVLLLAPPTLYDEKEWKERQRSPQYYPSVVTLRLSLFTPYFRQWRKIIHLDGDIIVVGDLSGLLSVRIFAAVPDFGATLGVEFIDPLLFYDFFSGTYDMNAPAFNAGVFVFDTSIIRNDSYDSIRLLFDKYYEQCRFAEQSILNLFFYKKWKPLPWNYNVFNHYLPKKNPNNIDGLTILHFPGFPEDPRPWEEHSPFFYLWRDNLLGKQVKHASAEDSVHAPVNKKKARNWYYVWYFQFVYLLRLTFYRMFKYRWITTIVFPFLKRHRKIIRKICKFV